jgi:colanic acid biosynthesis glycosyl transferase WcaI
MRILFYGINYFPELTGIGKYTGEACEWLATQGHDVEIITTPPYYPAWQISENYRGKAWHTENINGVKVHRCPFYVPAQVSSLKRMISDVSFITSSSIFWFKMLFSRKFDVVVCVCPPFLIGLLPTIYRKTRGVPFVFHVQDLQIDIAYEMGMIKNKRLVHFLFKIEKYLMNQATIVSSISDGMLAKIKEK